MQTLCEKKKKFKKSIGNNMPLEMAADDVIVGNLNLQLKYLLGENILEEINNGKPKT